MNMNNYRGFPPLFKGLHILCVFCNKPVTCQYYLQNTGVICGGACHEVSLLVAYKLSTNSYAFSSSQKWTLRDFLQFLNFPSGSESRREAQVNYGFCSPACCHSEDSSIQVVNSLTEVSGIQHSLKLHFLSS